MKKQDTHTPSVSAGLPNAAETALETPLDFNKLFFTSPHSTYVMRVEAGQTVGSAASSGDLLIVDRSVEPSTSSTVVMYLDGEMRVGRLADMQEAQQEYLFWGTVTYTVSPQQ